MIWISVAICIFMLSHALSFQSTPHSTLKKIKCDASTAPHEVAKHGDEYEDIVEVLAHRFKGNKKRSSDLQFHIVWGKSSIPQWENWSTSISSNGKVHEYLKNNQLRRYIPRKYTWPKDHPEYEPPTRPKRK